MIEYIYIVKCPGCEDEMFNFFTDARMQCDLLMSKKPYITQVEVERNDFGECIDSHDLGTVWSWEEAMKDTEGKYTDAEPTKSIFTKDDLKFMADGKDPEFDNLDNSVDGPETDTVVEHINDRPASVESTQELSGIDNAVVDCKVAKVITHSEDEKPVACGKPIPEGMTIEQLVEEMEENEDTVECTWCEELFDKSKCRKEVNLGWLCSRCEAAIKSRGETLTFKENNYWDFLDEDVEHAEKKTWLVFSGDNPIEVGEVYANTEEEAISEAERKFPDLKYNDYDGAVQIVPADVDVEPEAVYDLGNTYDGGYPDETSEVSDSHLKLCPECGKETFDIETGICVECGFN